ncbi:MAG: hypothetical protein ACFFCV_11700 [Promethearchaeota archaeon]
MVLKKEKNQKIKEIFDEYYEMFEIDLEQFNFDSFYEQIVDVVCHDEGWINDQKAIFHSVEQRDYCLLRLEENFGIRGSETKSLIGIANLLYNVLFEDFQKDNKISRVQEGELKKLLLEIIMFDHRDFCYLVKKPNDKVKRFREMRKFQLLEQRPIEYHQLELKINKLKDKINMLQPEVSNKIIEMIDAIDIISNLSNKVPRR